MRKFLSLLALIAVCAGLHAADIYSYVLNASNVAAGTHTVTGGTAIVAKGFATGGTNEIVIGSQTYYKFNSSTPATCTLATGNFAAGDVISLDCACGTSDKSGKGVKLNSIVLDPAKTELVIKQ